LIRSIIDLFVPGSSPLARGLHGFGFDDAYAGGIIPARAGFTRPGSAGRSRGPDHPRSRGVYKLNNAGMRCPDGSSPLARGLRSYKHRDHDIVRIIPARAGFTHHPLCARRQMRDHPRSRGVY